MSYIEEKYTKKISEILDNLINLEIEIKNLLSEKNIVHADKIAKLCAACNREINLILKKYYPEIMSLDAKLKIKSRMKFYYDLIDKLTDFIRNVEEFNKLDDKYYDAFIDFIEKKEELIAGKYKDLSAKELTAFYDKKTRESLEKILEEKLASNNREFFTIGPLEEEIKKIAKIEGANEIEIDAAGFDEKRIFPSAQSKIIVFIDEWKSELELDRIIMTIKRFLESKGYIVMRHENYLITNAELLH
jgi:hypothetical protein